MREIKFRAWDEVTRQYIFVASIDLCNHNAYGLPLDLEEHQDEISIPTLATLEQFTGLKDKNGRDIYEGDIVEAWFDGGPVGGEYKERVTIKMNEWGVNIQRWFIEGPEFTPVIVGNIHEIS